MKSEMKMFYYDAHVYWKDFAAEQVMTLTADVPVLL